MSDCHSCAGCAVATAPPPARPAVRPHVVAIIGPPNSGKSTLFNRLTGLRQKVANFPGVTVEQRIGRAKMNNQREVILVDLPGVYSLNPRSEDEQVTRDVLTGHMQDVPKPDAVLLILDSTNLGRHLVLAAPILSLKLPTLVILNMADDLSNRGGQIDTGELASQLGAPVALISASKGDGVEKVFQFMVGTSAGTTSLAPPKVELPILQDVPRCRQWAREVGIGAAYQAPTSAFVDAPPGRGLPASGLRAPDLPGGGRGRVSNHLPRREAAHGRVAGAGANVRSLDRKRTPGWNLSLVIGGRRLERRRLGDRFPSPDSAALFVYRNPGGLRLSGASGPDCRSHHGEIRAARKIVHSPALGLCLRGARHHGHPHHRKQARPAGDHPDRAVHDLLGAASRCTF